MEFENIVRSRRMVRRYASEVVDPTSVERMLRHAVRAPNAGFTQGWAFLVLDTPDDVARFWAVTSPGEGAPSSWLRGMRSAPVVIVVLTSKDAYLDRYAEHDKGWSDRSEDRWSAPYWHVDAGMAALLILQTAVDEGLGACFFGVPPTRVEAFRQEFDVPGAYSPTGAITVGHPELAASAFSNTDPTTAPTTAPTPAVNSRGSVARRARKPLDDVVHRGRWSGEPRAGA